MTTPDPALPVHEDEMTSGHEGRPTMAEQDKTHGAGLPAPDHGESDEAKAGKT